VNETISARPKPIQAVEVRERKDFILEQQGAVSNKISFGLHEDRILEDLVEDRVSQALVSRRQTDEVHLRKEERKEEKRREERENARG
jgi:protein-arginine kinase